MKEKSELILRIIPKKQDVNDEGYVFGGWLLGQADAASAVLAVKFVKGRVVTIGVENFTFKAPVYPMDMLDFYGEITKIGETSIAVNIKIVVIQRAYMGDKPYYFVPHQPPYTSQKVENKENIQPTPNWLIEPILACEGVFTFVAVGRDGKKKSIKGENNGN